MEENESSEFDFSDLTPAEKPVVLPGRKEKFVIREASGEAVAKWRNAQMSGATFNSEGKMERAGEIGELPLIMVRECLFQVVNPNDIRKVDRNLVNSIPQKVIDKLYDWILRTSGLINTPGEDELKK